MLATKKKKFESASRESLAAIEKLIKDKDYDEAEEQARKIIDGDNQNWHAIFLLATCHFEQNFMVEALVLLEHLLDNQPDFEPAKHMLARINQHYQNPMQLPPLIHRQKAYTTARRDKYSMHAPIHNVGGKRLKDVALETLQQPAPQQPAPQQTDSQQIAATASQEQVPEKVPHPQPEPEPEPEPKPAAPVGKAISLPDDF